MDAYEALQIVAAIKDLRERTRQLESELAAHGGSAPGSPQLRAASVQRRCIVRSKALSALRCFDGSASEYEEWAFSARALFVAERPEMDQVLTCLSILSAEPSEEEVEDIILTYDLTTEEIAISWDL